MPGIHVLRILTSANVGGLARQIRERRPDLVHTHLTKAGVLGERLVRGTSMPLVHTYHGHDLRDEVSWLAGKLRRTPC